MLKCLAYKCEYEDFKIKTFSTQYEIIFFCVNVDNQRLWSHFYYKNLMLPLDNLWLNFMGSAPTISTYNNAKLCHKSDR